LPLLLRGVGTLDLFIHDSLHTEFNMLFECVCSSPPLI